MKKSNGFTLIELLIAIAMIGIVASIAFGGISGVRHFTSRGDQPVVHRTAIHSLDAGRPSATFKCVHGLAFLVNPDGTPSQQIVDENGQGERCAEAPTK